MPADRRHIYPAPVVRAYRLHLAAVATGRDSMGKLPKNSMVPVMANTVILLRVIFRLRMLRVPRQDNATKIRQNSLVYNGDVNSSDVR